VQDEDQHSDGGVQHVTHRIRILARRGR
jgi:hypothetical protein